MDRREFKRELELHKNQIDFGIKYLPQVLEDIKTRNYKFYEFLESNYFDLEEGLVKPE